MASPEGMRSAVFMAVARRVVPEVATLQPAELAAFTAIVDRALQDRPGTVRRRLALFLRVVRWLPALRWGRPFDRLDDDRRDRFLRWLQACPAGKLRQGFWGLKTLVFMGYYGRPAVWAEIGYAPRRDATEELRARA